MYYTKRFMRHIPNLTAGTYLKSFSSGRTAPCVLLCYDENGNSAGEFVVKLKGNIETGAAGLLRELLGSLLADELGLKTPGPAIVRVTKELADAITDQRVSESIRQSEGLNYGSKNLTGGYYTWPDDKTIPPSLMQAACDIFIFDALIQNPDRRRSKSNMLWKSDELVVIDHEMAFSFLLALFPSAIPWLLKDQPYLDKHIFYRHLRHGEINLAGITNAIESITSLFWEEAEAGIPNEWLGTEFARIFEHIESIRAHLEEFMNEIKRILQ